MLTDSLPENEHVPDDEPLKKREYDVFPYMNKDGILTKELATFEANKKALIAEHGEGKFVLIKDEQIISVFKDEVEGALAGYKQFGYVPLLVKEIREKERTYWI